MSGFRAPPHRATGSGSAYERSRRRLDHPHPLRDPALFDAVRMAVPSDRVTVHAEACPMGDSCDCVPITLEFGATA